MTRVAYELTQEQLDKLLDACSPVPMVAIHCGEQKGPMENVRVAWMRLGKELGFDYMTAEPTGQGDRFFTAIPLKEES